MGEHYLTIEEIPATDIKAGILVNREAQDLWAVNLIVVICLRWKGKVSPDMLEAEYKKNQGNAAIEYTYSTASLFVNSVCFITFNLLKVCIIVTIKFTLENVYLNYQDAG